MDIGHALKVCRSAKKFSLEELAGRSGLSQSYLSMIESGKREPTLTSVQKISAAMGIPVTIVLFLASDDEELRGLDAETKSRLSDAVLEVMRA